MTALACDQLPNAVFRLNEIAYHVPAGRHGVIVLDQARWHTAKHLHIPENLTLLPLPPYSPELNPQENVWEVLRADSLANRCFNSVEHIVDAACEAWKAFVSVPDKIGSSAKFVGARRLSQFSELVI